MAPRGRKRGARQPPAAEAPEQAGAPQKRARSQAEGSPGGTGPRIVIEHWNSFEVSLVKEDGSTVELWSGIGKGPPRKLKFPQPEAVVEALKSSLA
ncbi:selenoprotein H [Grus japonensis]|uniref:Selenoprotein H n=1 Tax=Grus japonensis TaxID=30415 RepID=A0ABC9WVS3_GRUJA